MKNIFKKVVSLMVSLALLMSMISVMTVSAYDPVDTIKFNLMGENAVNIENPNDRVNFMFIPEYTGNYLIWTAEANLDTAFNLYDNNNEFIGQDADVSEEDKNFRNSIYVEADRVYFLETYINGDASDVTYTIYSEPLDAVDSFEIASEDGSFTMRPNEKKYLSIKNIVPEGTQYNSIKWHSSDDNIACVDENGLVTAISTGTVTITAVLTYGVSASVDIIVEPYTVLNENEITEINVNEAYQRNYYEFIPSASGNYFFDFNIENDIFFKLWSPADDINVDQTYSKDYSYTTLYLTEGISYYIQTEFVDEHIGNYSLEVSKYPDDVYLGCETEGILQDNVLNGVVGETAQLFVGFVPEDSKEKVTWSSNNIDVASVTQDGLVTFNKTGNATIEVYTKTGRYLWTEVRVGLPALEASFGEEFEVSFDYESNERKIKFTPEVSGLYKLQSNSFLGYYINGYIYDQHNNMLIEKGGNSGFEIGYYLEAGKTYYFVIYSYNGETTIPMIIVGADYLEDYQINAESSVIYNGLKTEVYITSAEGSDKNVYESFSFSIDDETVAFIERVSNSRVAITGLKEGTVTLTAVSQNNITKTFTFTVVEPAILEEGILSQINIDEPPYITAFKFIPTVSAKYEFYFEGISEIPAIYAELKTGTEYLTGSNREGTDESFRLQWELEAGKTYFVRIVSDAEEELSVGVVKTVPTESIVINGGAQSVSGIEGQNIILKYEALPLHADLGTPEWLISDESIVRKEGQSQTCLYLYLLKEGTCEITVTVGEFTDTITVIVEGTPELILETPVEVSISGQNEGTKFKFVPDTDGEYVFYSVGEYDTYAYLEGEGFYAEDYESGENSNYKIVAYLNAGQTYYLRNFKTNDIEYAKFNVVAARAVDVEEIIIGETEIDLNVGDTYVIPFKIEPINSKNEGIMWYTSDSDVVSIEEYYPNSTTIRAISGGTAIITAMTDSGVSASLTVNVRGTETISIGRLTDVDITYNYERVTFSLNVTEAGVYEIGFNNSFYPTIVSIWQNNVELSSSDRYGGCFQMWLDEGNYQVVTGFDIEAIGSYSVYVQKTVTPETVIINNGAESLDCYVGTTQKLDVMLTPGFANELMINWSSSDESVATVEKGFVSIHGEGSAVITASLPNQNSDSIVINGIGSDFLNVGEIKTITLGQFEEHNILRVNIDQTGWYRFNINSGNNISVSLYDANMDLMQGLNCNMPTLCELTSSGIYYLMITNHSYGEGTAGCIISKAPVIESLTIESEPENMQHEIGTPYHYDGLTVKAVFEGGMTQYWTWGDYNLLAGCYEVSVYEQFDENGNYDYTCISAGGKECRLTLQIIESNFLSIEVYSGSVGQFYENWGGSAHDDHYHYDYERYLQNMQFIIRYRDGSYKIASYYDEVDGCLIEARGSDCFEHWTLGGDNYITIIYKNDQIKIPVSVVENPVERVVLNNPPITEITLGDMRYGEMWDNEYYIRWNDLSDLKFTVYYKDGTSKMFGADDAVKEYGEYYWEGQSGFIDEISIYEAGTYTANFWYLGACAEFEFVVNESPVTDIEVLKGPDKTTTKLGFMSDLYGMQLKITYFDGSEKIITIDNQNISLVFDYARGPIYNVKDGDNLISIYANYGDETHEYYMIQYYAVNEYFGPLEKEYIEYGNVLLENICKTGKKMKLTVDGEEISFADAVIIFTQQQNEYYQEMGYLSTADGFLQYSIYTRFDEKGYVDGCDVNVMGGEYHFDIQSGDINCDGAVDVRDLVAAKNMLADMEEPEDRMNADMNFDGKFDATDLPIYIKNLLGVSVGL